MTTAGTPAVAGRRRSGPGGSSSRSAPTARRLVALMAALALGLSAILVRLVQLQVHDASAYRALAWGQRVRTIELPASRC